MKNAELKIKNAKMVSDELTYIISIFCSRATPGARFPDVGLTSDGYSNSCPASGLIHFCILHSTFCISSTALPGGQPRANQLRAGQVAFLGANDFTLHLLQVARLNQ